MDATSFGQKSVGRTSLLKVNYSHLITQLTLFY
jgi:hypothetical protein